MISPEKLKILTPLQKLPKNVGDLGKLIVAKESWPKSNKLPVWSHSYHSIAKGSFRSTEVLSSKLV